MENRSTLLRLAAAITIAAQLITGALPVQARALPTRDFGPLQETTAPVVITHDATMDTNEAGDNLAAIQISLSQAPASGTIVRLLISSSNEDEGTVSPSQLDFTPDDYATPQDVTMTGVDDLVDDGNVEYSVNIAIDPANSDPAFTGTIDPITVTNLDDEIPAEIVLSTTTINSTESEADADPTFTVALNRTPAEATTVSVTISDGAEASLNLSSLEFTTTDPQTVTVYSMDDAIDDGDQNFTITVAVESGAPDFAALDPVDISGHSLDDDTAGVSVDGFPVNLAEGGSTGSFTVALNSEPTADVTISAASDDPSEGTVTASRTFTAANWSTAQAFTVTPQQDTIVDGVVGYQITLSAASTDSKYQAWGSHNYSASTSDDDSPSLVITGGPLTTSETGSTASFTVRLGAQPATGTTVNVAVSSNKTGEAQVLDTALSFNSSNWSTNQTVDVQGVDDTIIDGSQSYTITLKTTWPGYTVGDQTVSGSNTDDDTGSIVVSPTSLSTTEGQGTVPLSVHLGAGPSSSVTVTVASTNPQEVTVATTTLTFTTANWAANQTVNLNVLNDDYADGSQPYDITFTASGGAPGYSGLMQTVHGTNDDTDTANLVVSKTTVATGEASTTDTFTVHLTAIPLSAVTVAVGVDDLTEAHVSTTTLTFQANSTALTNQTVTVTGQDDSLVDGEQPYTITLATTWTGKTVPNHYVVGTNTDNDTAGLTVSKSTVATTENGATDSFTVKLNAAPVNPVTITITSDKTAEATVNPTGLTFTDADWNTAKTVTVTGQNDAILDGSVSFTVGLVASGDSSFVGKTASLAGANADNDTASITLTPTSVTTTENPGDANTTFNVKLGIQPVASVTLTMTGLNLDEAAPVTGSNSVTFTTGNWNTNQSLTVLGVDDAFVDGSQAFTMRLTATGAVGYEGQHWDLTGNNTDNDVASIVVDQATLNTTEGGSNVTLNVHLGAGPTGDVSVAVASTVTREATVNPTNLTFTTSNWATDQQVTVQVQDDSYADGTVDYNITLNASGGGYDGVTQTVVGHNADNDLALILSDKDTVTTSEVGVNDTFNVSLSSIPLTQVTLALSGSDSTEATVTPTTIVIPANATALDPHPVTVYGLNDQLADGTVHYTVTISATGDSHFAGQTLIVGGNNADNDTAGFSLSKTTLSTAEGGVGRNDSFTVALTSQPLSNVTVSVESDDTSEATVLPASLTFTTANWSSSQTINVTGENDSVLDGDVIYHVNLAVTAGGADYAGKTAQATGTNRDNETLSVVVSPTSISTTENQGDANPTFTVALGAQPTADVTMLVSNLDSDEAHTIQSSLTFTTTNWGTAQTVTVVGDDDSLIDGNQAYTIRLTGSGGAYGYDGYIKDVPGINIDNDAGSIVVDTASLTTTEGGPNATLNVHLGAGPASDVTVAVASTVTREVTVNPASLTFTAANWNTNQQVTVQVQDDQYADGTVAYNITLNASGDGYTGVSKTVPGTNADNDTADLQVSKTTLTTTEAGVNDSFSVSLSAIPLTTVTVSVGSSDMTEATVSPTTINIPSDATALDAHTVTVTHVDDSLVDGSQPYTVTVSAAGDSHFAGQAHNLTGSNADNDTAGITLSKHTVATSEGGTNDSFTVVLNAAPVNPVTISVTSSDTTEATVDKASLSFNNANWSTAQTVNVSGVDDTLLDGTIAYTIDLAATGDTAFAGLTDQVAGNNADNETVSIILNPTTVNTTENQADADPSFTVRLGAQPVGNVTLTLESQNTDEALPGQTTVNFTTANWNTAQTVSVIGVDDSIIDGSQPFTIRLTASGAAGYDGQHWDLTGSNADDDVASLVVGGEPVATTEGGTSAAFTVRLSSQPTANVTIAVSSGDTTEGTVLPASLTFTTSNWNTNQTVTVTPVDDTVADGTIEYLITLNPSSADANYGPLPDRTINATNADNEVASLVITHTGDLVTSEAGTGDEFNVALSAQPTATVTVTVTSSDTTEATVHAQDVTRTFTTANWNTAQRVRIQAVDDFIVDGAQPYTINLAAAGGGVYAGKTAALNGSNADNDTAGIVANATVSVTEGSTVQFQVHLNASPADGNTVTVAASIAQSSYATVSPASLNFTSANWSTNQTLTITGVNDLIYEPAAQNFTLVLAASGDPAFNGITSNVAGTTVDNDPPLIVLTAAANFTTTENQVDTNPTFTVALGSQPPGPVTVLLTSDDETEAVTTVASLNFTTANWATAQTVTVIGLDDSIVDGNITYHITASISPTTTGYPAPNVVLTGVNTDNDVLQMVVSGVPTTLSTAENGTAKTFSVRLNGPPPSGTMNVTVASLDTTEATVSPATLTFTTATWMTDQTVTVTPVDDFYVDGTQNYTVRLTNATLTNSPYNISGTNSDDDVAGVTIPLEMLNLTTTEAAGTTHTATFTVRLTAQPNPGTSVTLNFTSSNTQEGTVSPSQIIFSNTGAAWNVPQTVTITAVDDSFADGNQVYQVTGTVTTTDTAFTAVTVATVTVQNLDDDSPPQASNDSYTFKQNFFSIVSSYGLFSNDTVAYPEWSLVLDCATISAPDTCVFKTGDVVNGELKVDLSTGAFTFRQYTPASSDPNLAMLQIFTYHIHYNTGYKWEDTSTATVTLMQTKQDFDATHPANGILPIPPELTWLQPITQSDGNGTYVVTQDSVTLEIELDPDVDYVDWVNFYRWDHVLNKFVTIGSVSTGPYRIVIPASDLQDGTNQVFVQGYRASNGEDSGGQSTFRLRILLVGGLDRHLFLPLTRK